MEYDYVLIDTAISGLITDALLMMRHADATLFVVNTRFASKDRVINALGYSACGSRRQTRGSSSTGVRIKKSNTTTARTTATVTGMRVAMVPDMATATALAVVPFRTRRGCKKRGVTAAAS